MSFGKPSAVFRCSPPAAAAAAAVSPTSSGAVADVSPQLEQQQQQHHSSNTTKHHAQSPLHFTDVRAHLEELNRQFPPVLTEHELLSVEENVYREINHLLGRPLEEVFPEACATWTTILVRAKGEPKDIDRWQ